MMPATPCSCMRRLHRFLPFRGIGGVGKHDDLARALQNAFAAHGQFREERMVRSLFTMPIVSLRVLPQIGCIAVYRP